MRAYLIFDMYLIEMISLTAKPLDWLDAPTEAAPFFERGGKEITSQEDLQCHSHARSLNLYSDFCIENNVIRLAGL